MSPIDVATLPRPIDIRTTLWCMLALAGALSVAMVSELTESPISCERQKGSFSNDFLPDFDINSFDCRVSWTKNSSTIRFWRVSPYVGALLQKWLQRIAGNMRR
jgi:hypothetical protein